MGENYGHVIQEALSAGCPCILSDQTPWQDLEEKGVGFVYPLRDLSEFSKKVEQYARMNEQEWKNMIDNTQRYAIENSNKKVETTGYRTIFDTL